MVEDEPPFDNDADEFPPPDEEGAESGEQLEIGLRFMFSNDLIM